MERFKSKRELMKYAVKHLAPNDCWKRVVISDSIQKINGYGIVENDDELEALVDEMWKEQAKRD